MRKSNNTVTNNNSNNNLGGINMNERINTSFVEAVKAALEDMGYVVEINDVTKNNGIHLTGLSIKTVGSNISPTVYMEQFYKDYQAGKYTISEVAAEVAKIYEENKNNCSFDVSSITDLDLVKDKICYKVINAERNKELLNDAPHVIVCEDLAVIFYVLVSMDLSGTASITIRNNLAKTWGINTDDLFRISLSNTQRLFHGMVRNIADFIGGLFEENEFYDMAISDNDMFPLYVCTNESKINGAGVILYDGLLHEFADKMNCDFYIIPSSIHETLLVPMTSDMEVSYLRSMVHEVNGAELLPEEILSDNVYIYRRETDAIALA